MKDETREGFLKQIDQRKVVSLSNVIPNGRPVERKDIEGASQTVRNLRAVIECLIEKRDNTKPCQCASKCEKEENDGTVLVQS